MQINITSNPLELYKAGDGDFDHSGWLVFNSTSTNIDSFEQLSGTKEKLKAAWADSSINKVATDNGEIVGDNK